MELNSVNGDIYGFLRTVGSAFSSLMYGEEVHGLMITKKYKAMMEMETGLNGLIMTGMVQPG